MATMTRQFLDAIDASSLVGLRDRVLIGVRVYSFACVSAVIHRKVEDFSPAGYIWKIHLHEKDGKFRAVFAYHNLVNYLHAHIRAARIAGEKKTPIFRNDEGKIA